MPFYRSKTAKFIIIAIIILVIVFIYVQRTLTPIFFSLAEIEAYRIVNRTINESVKEEIGRISYEDLITFKYNNNGEVAIIQHNTNYINSFISKVSLKIDEKLILVNKMNVSIPLATILGIEILAGFGPDLHAKIIPVGFLSPPEIKDSFTAAGINQTRHKIFMDVNVQLKLIVPFKSKLINISTNVLVNEVTIIGKVPKVYIGIEQGELPSLFTNPKNND